MPTSSSPGAANAVRVSGEPGRPNYARVAAAHYPAALHRGGLERPIWPNLRLRVPPLAVTWIAGVLGWIVAYTFPGVSLRLGGRASLAATLGLLGIVSSVAGVAAFRRARTTVNPLQPTATTTLVVSGIYHVTRNPMYLGFLLVLLGELAWLANPLAWLAAPVFVLYLNRFQIRPEEEALRARFGDDYLSYTTRVRRWI